MTKRDRRGILALVASAALLPLAGTDAWARPRTLSGTVSYRERMALPPTAVAQVQLLDVSLADAKAVVIAETTVKAGPGSPIRYTLTYDPGRLRRGHTYALQARIMDHGRLLFINTTRHTAFGPHGSEAHIRVERVR